MMPKKQPGEPTKEATTLAGKSPFKSKDSSISTECCGSNSSCQSTSQKTMHQASTPFSSESKKGPKTRITIKYDVGFSNTIYLRGKGANLTWDKGVSLKNIKPDEWVWEIDIPFTNGEFKVLVNDKYFEIGQNHTLTCGANIQYTPQF